MIRGSFRHARGIGPVAELKLREMGFLDWDECLRRRKELPFTGRKGTSFISELENSVSAYSRKDLGFFVSRFSTGEQWRILGEYLDQATFVDIETTGLNWNNSHASVIAALHRGRVYSFLCGVDLEDFLAILDEASLLVTFNGGSFDLPFIEKTFHLPCIDVPHIDLRWVAYHQGYRGGLKAIERMMNIRRPAEVKDIDGFEAVDLYHRWRAGDRKAGADLVRYCRTDTVCTYMVACRLLEEKGAAFTARDNNELFREAIAWTAE